LRHVPIHVIGDGVVPGGQLLDVPPQQLQSQPSIAQYFQ
jgi:hypothetical protein